MFSGGSKGNIEKKRVKKDYIASFFMEFWQICSEYLHIFPQVNAMVSNAILNGLTQSYFSEKLQTTTSAWAVCIC